MTSYTFNYHVRLDDLDYMGIVGNSQWLIFLERARIDLLEKIGFPFSEMMKQKIGGVVAEANIRFIKPAYFNDRLTINLKPQKLFSKGFVLNYIVLNQNNFECLTADITIVFVNHCGKSIKIPEEIKNKLLLMSANN
jgi:acyl-CoA thioester hydrolase